MTVASPGADSQLQSFVGVKERETRPGKRSRGFNRDPECAKQQGTGKEPAREALGPKRVIP